MVTARVAALAYCLLRSTFGGANCSNPEVGTCRRESDVLYSVPSFCFPGFVVLSVDAYE